VVASRARWAVDLLDVRPDQHLLEIGCGNGTAISQVCERLTTGSILAIDRSASAVARATHRNAQYIAGGLARIEAVDLADLLVPARRFDTVFAVNVNLLGTAGETGLAQLIRRALRPSGRFVLCYEQPSPARLAERAARVSDNLRAAGLATTVDWPGAHRTCVTATSDAPAG
jgi:cyclopropane fatty-acyl-phospholipid synthase-like methyltransferase